MSFPLADWIDGHSGCRHNLAISGMVGSIPPPTPTPADVRRADANELRRLLAEDLRVDARRLFLTTGASQANSLVVLFLARRRRGGAGGACRVCLPEYPPLFDSAREAGFRLTEEPGSAELALLSQPRNPEGDLWDRTRVLDWASGARWLLVDETFREFAGARSLLGTDLPNLWATGSFTKFFAGDDLRAGYLVAPEGVDHEFARFHGLVTNLLSPHSIAGATRALRDRERTRRKVLNILRPNFAAVRAAFPHLRLPDGPVMFDRLETGEHGTTLARRALRSSVLVCPGSFFGDPSGVRLCLTRRSFAGDFRAYLAVRPPTPGRARSVSPRRSPTGRPARRPPAGNDRGKAAPS
ncbi:MAG TPA: aminotransferase class I/II-fold pyridoxal phosphate-dependent enzyme [Thermoplasmata archaeon]|jgi:histidinol-phosphate/aromatic aminotransferase/cobyric acid decarboxylase-like protein|nr:aminotransferase class I/II-fold pyridoxal phosphate-dependent enzyme [Thermoplasmata archaeon]